MYTNNITFKGFLYHNFYGNLKDNKNSNNLMTSNSDVALAVERAEYCASNTDPRHNFKLIYDQKTDTVTCSYMCIDLKNAKKIITKNPLVVSLNEFIDSSMEIVQTLFHKSEKIKQDLLG